MGSAELYAIADRQHGLIADEQSGLTPRQLAWRVGRGELVRVYRGVLKLAGSPGTPMQAALAGCLACGPDAVASHTSAATVWGYEVPAPDVAHVTVTGRHPRPRGVTVHRTDLGPSDVVTHSGLRVTSPARTLIDIAGLVDEEVLEIALDDAARRSLVQVDRLAARLSLPDLRRTPGTRTLRHIVAPRVGSRAIGGGLESRFFHLLRRAKLPLPVRQHPVRTPHGPRKIDFAYPDAMIAIEIDDYESHTTRARFDDDRVRREDLRLLGWAVVQITWTMIRLRPDEVVWTVSRALGLVPSRWRRA